MKRLRLGSRCGWLLLPLAACAVPDGAEDAESTVGHLSQGISDTVVTRHGVSTEMREAGGRLTEAQRNSGTCAQQRALYSIGQAQRTSGANIVKEPRNYTCASFAAEFFPDDAPNARLTKSVRLVEPCVFVGKHIEIAGSDILLDCGGSFFNGNFEQYYGITFPNNATDSSTNASLLPVIHDVEIRSCNFMNYRGAGLFLTNQFNRRNLLDQQFYDSRLPQMAGPLDLDELDEEAPSGEIRALSPHHITIRDLMVVRWPPNFGLPDPTPEKPDNKDYGNMGIYIQNHLHDVSIDGVTVFGTRGSIYLDHGTREVGITNSCFYDDEDDDSREFIAVDASARNRIEGNLFYGNRQGAVRLYKNCSEHFAEAHQFSRRQPSDENRILGNAIVGFHGDHIGVSVAHRKWDDYITAEDEDLGCGDPVLYSGTGRHYRDYARNNEIAGNVFFASNLAVRVLDDGNHVHDNFVYVKRAKTKPTFQVGHALDPTLARSVRNVELIRNWIEIQDQANRPSSIRPDVVTFPGEARGATTFARNVMESAPMCAMPFLVPSSNVAGEACRFGDLSAPKVVVEPFSTGTISDGGRIHGSGTFTCTPTGWKALSGYCCSGTGCTRKPLTGVFQ